MYIVTDPRFTIHQCGFGMYEGAPVVFANPHVIETAHAVGERGEIFPFSLKRFCSHEFQHAAQPGMAEEAIIYAQRREQYFQASLPEVPWEQYRNRILAVRKDEQKLKRILGKIYDKHLYEPAKAGLERMLQESAQDPIIQEFTWKYETPAIDFENLMMGKYESEAKRMADYIQSGSFSEEAWKADREGFINNSIASLKAEEATQQSSRVPKRRSSRHK